MSDQKQSTEITFETGYERLKTIAERIEEEEVPVSEMCNLFAEGKGLERALGDYLDTQQARLEEIERGEGIEAFRIVATAPQASGAGAGDPPASAAAASRGGRRGEPPEPVGSASANGADAFEEMGNNLF